ncbi:MAG: succinate dehydrogenase [Verrucomicrobiota bacterium]|nr:succinate dehydrogenase [Verrucomicrobiota bacterium]
MNSSEFFWRRIHSFTGFWLFLYLILHLVTNSQAGLWIGDDGEGFVRMVNKLESLPYLQLIEIFLIGVPILIHGAWGISRALQARENHRSTDGTTPSLPFERNRAFAWQRLTSWILLIGIVGHVVQMRFLDAPKRISVGTKESDFVKVSFDPGLLTLADRLGVTLFTPQEIVRIEGMVRGKLEAVSSSPTELDPLMQQEISELTAWVTTLTSFSLKNNELIAVSDTPGTGYLLMLRNIFKDPVMAAFYTLFLLAAAFHAGNGLWTFLITWGVLLSFRSQKRMLLLSAASMLLLSLLGLAAIWCSYWINLRY